MMEKQKKLFAEQIEAKKRQEEKFEREKKVEISITKALDESNGKIEEQSVKSGQSGLSMFNIFDQMSQTDYYKKRDYRNTSKESVFKDSGKIDFQNTKEINIDK